MSETELFSKKKKKKIRKKHRHPPPPNLQVKWMVINDFSLSDVGRLLPCRYVSPDIWNTCILPKNERLTILF